MFLHQSKKILVFNIRASKVTCIGPPTHRRRRKPWEATHPHRANLMPSMNGEARETDDSPRVKVAAISDFITARLMSNENTSRLGKTFSSSSSYEPVSFREQRSMP